MVSIFIFLLFLCFSLNVTVYGDVFSWIEKKEGKLYFLNAFKIYFDLKNILLYIYENIF